MKLYALHRGGLLGSSLAGFLCLSSSPAEPRGLTEGCAGMLAGRQGMPGLQTGDALCNALSGLAGR